MYWLNFLSSLLWPFSYIHRNALIVLEAFFTMAFMIGKICSNTVGRPFQTQLKNFPVAFIHWSWRYDAVFLPDVNSISTFLFFSNNVLRLQKHLTMTKIIYFCKINFTDFYRNLQNFFLEKSVKFCKIILQNFYRNRFQSL